jgi:hypothetical protein
LSPGSVLWARYIDVEGKKEPKVHSPRSIVTIFEPFKLDETISSVWPGKRRSSIKYKSSLLLRSSPFLYLFQTINHLNPLQSSLFFPLKNKHTSTHTLIQHSKCFSQTSSSSSPASQPSLCTRPQALIPFRSAQNSATRTTRPGSTASPTSPPFAFTARSWLPTFGVMRIGILVRLCKYVYT